MVKRNHREMAMFRFCFCVTLLLSSLLLVSMSAAAQSTSHTVSHGANSLPDNFHGKVSYFGNHSGERVGALSGDSNKPVPGCLRADRRCPIRIGGSLQVELEFDGDLVRGSFRGSGGLNASGLIGRRQGVQCKLFDQTDGSVWAGRCDRDGFAGTVKSVPNAPAQLSLEFQVVGTKFVDDDERNRRKARELNIEFLRRQIASDDPIEKRLIALVELEAYGWMSYDVIRESIEPDRRNRPNSKKIVVHFDLAGGGKGQAEAEIDRGVIKYVAFYFPDLGHRRKTRILTLPTDPDDYGDDDRQSSFVKP